MTRDDGGQVEVMHSENLATHHSRMYQDMY